MHIHVAGAADAGIRHQCLEVEILVTGGTGYQAVTAYQRESGDLPMIESRILPDGSPSFRGMAIHARDALGKGPVGEGRNLGQEVMGHSGGHQGCQDQPHPDNDSLPEGLLSSRIGTPPGRHAPPPWQAMHSVSSGR